MFLALPVSASAGVNITGMTVNGGATATVAPGDSVSVVVNVTTTSSDDWESTSGDWITDGNPSTCFNTPDHTSSGSYSETFSFIAPLVDGVYDLSLGAHGSNSSIDNSCATSADDIDLFADVLTVFTPPAPTEDTAPLCSDTLDNDGDTLVDLADPNCSAFVPAPSAPSVLAPKPAPQGGLGTGHCDRYGKPSCEEWFAQFNAFLTSGQSGQFVFQKNLGAKLTPQEQLNLILSRLLEIMEKLKAIN